MKEDKGYFVFKKEDEKLHKILIGDAKRGELKVYSKETQDGKIVYKIFIEPENDKARILREGKTFPEEFNTLIHYYENVFLKPAGSEWREIRPTVINLDERDMSKIRMLTRSRGVTWSQVRGVNDPINIPREYLFKK